ncbi:TPA: flagellar assembly protein FlgQ [Campylobacter jejuni]
MERIVCLLIFLSFKLFAQDEFIFWAELSNKNFILFHQNQNLSLAMTQSENVEEQWVCEISYSDQDLKVLPRTSLGLIDDNMLKTIKFNFLNSHKDELSDCFIGAKISVKDIVNTDLLRAQSETYVKILPLRFTVEFGEQNAIIYYLKKK